MLVAGATPVVAQRPLPPDSLVRAITRQRVDERRNVGIAVGLIDADGRTRSFAYGRGAGDAPLDEHSLFEIGSITKTFTGAILADMVAKGSVRLDQPVGELLPAGTVIPSRGGRQITLADLATHTSGLPRLPGNLEPRDQANPYADYDGKRLLDFLARYQLPRDIGAQYEYSNLGVGLLGYALAAKAGMTYEQLVTDRILRPLGMRETASLLSPELRRRLAPGHGPDGLPVRNWELDALAGAGSLRSSVHDMLRYVAANIDPRASQLGPALVATHAKRFQTAQPNVSIGLTWNRVVAPSGDTLLIHNGGTAGYLTFVGFDPRRRVGVVVLSNSAVSVDDIGLHLLDQRIPLTKAPAVRKEIALSADALQRFVGEYPLAPNFVITITRTGDKLFAQATGQPQFALFAEAEAKFFFKVVDAQLEFETDATGNVTAVVLVQNGARQRAPKRGTGSTMRVPGAGGSGNP
ncbi:MAG: serine hydrolase [Cytophagaceae bacterium]|nr:serine hydrolase [Gemmatimonadaceae bacterium]